MANFFSKVSGSNFASGSGSGISPAPGCRPSPRTLISVVFGPDGSRRSIMCEVVSIDNSTRDVLVSRQNGLFLNDSDAGRSARVSWSGHGMWHESKAVLSGNSGQDASYMKMRLVGEPQHHERRRHVRSLKDRLVKMTIRHRSISGFTNDISEGALRATTDFTVPIVKGDQVQVELDVDRSEDAAPVALEGHVYRVTESPTGQRESVIMFDGLSASEEDFVRGIVYEQNLQENRLA